MLEVPELHCVNTLREVVNGVIKVSKLNDLEGRRKRVNRMVKSDSKLEREEGRREIVN